MDTFSIYIFGFTYLFGANFWFLNLSITKSISGVLIFVPYSMLVTFFIAAIFRIDEWFSIFIILMFFCFWDIQFI